MSDVDVRGGIWAVAIIFLVSTTVFTCLRVYVRVGLVAKFGPDDYAAVAAQILFLAYLTCQIGGVVHGTGRRLKILDRDQAELALHYWFYCEIWYALAGVAVKLSILLSLRRVTVKKIHRIIILGLMIWSIMLGLAFVLVVAFQCIPASDWWDLDPAKKRCIGEHVIESLTWTSSALSVACDWILGLFPFFIVKDLAIPFQQKVVVASILAFGALASTACCVRMAYVPSLSETYDGWNGDFLYETTPVAIWTTVELGIAITAMCLATQRPLVNKIFGISTSYTGSKHRSQNFSPYTSAECSSPVPFNNYRDARAAAMAIIDADDPVEPPQQAVGYSQFNVTKSMNVNQRELEAEYLEMGPSSSWKSQRSRERGS